MNKLCFYRGNKNSVLLALKIYTYIHNSLPKSDFKAANDAFYTSHSQKPVGTDSFFFKEIFFLSLSKKRSFELTNVCRV